MLHKTIKKVTEDIENLKYNTAISSLMISLNKIWEERGSTSENQIMVKEQLESLLKLLAPFAPHITEELWYELGNEKSIHLEDWPVFDEEKIKEEEMTIVVQVNGKVRGEFVVDVGESEEKIKEIALEQENVKKWVGDNEPKKQIYVKNKLVNIVV